MSVDDRTLRALEWIRLTEFLALEADSPGGRKLCREAVPHGQRALAQLALAETDEAASLVEARSGLNFEGLPDLAHTLMRVSAGAEASASELLSIKNMLVLARQAKASLGLLEKERFPRLGHFVPLLYALEPLAAAIEGAIDDGGEIKDTASPRLGGLRREVHVLDGQIKEELARIIHSPTLGKALQEPIYTQRNGRWVLPVTASMRSTIAGIVHDSSASGLTVYVEPMAVVEIANRQRLKEAEIEREIARILSELTQAAKDKHHELDSSFTNLVELDFIFARARFGKKYRGEVPEVSLDGTMLLRAARHPLLILQDPDRAPLVVPNDIALSAERRTMIVTGPNTGGKTVLLKTAGLLSLMLRAGMRLPVARGAKAPFFSTVMADIGDEQSLAQNLSTFSSHMTNIVAIVDRAGPGTLALLDEIGAGTDPREGVALARVILERLNESGSTTITTTHFGELKALAYTQDGFVNASLDFDDATLSPTYRLRLGVPGASKATTIAYRLGLSPDLVSQAEAYIEKTSEDIQRVIGELERRLSQLSSREEEVASLMARAQAAEEKALVELSELEAEREKLRLTYARDIEEEFKAARDLIRQTIAELQKEPTSRRAAASQKDLERLEEEIEWRAAPKPVPPVAVLVQGQKVRVRSLNQVGTIEDAGDPDIHINERRVTVRVGSFSVKVSYTDIEPAATPRQAGPKSKAGGGRAQREVFPTVARAANVFVRSEENTVDLRGQRVEAALASLERFLDRACVADLSPLMVIHGHGTGAVKAAVREYLVSSAYNLSFRPGETYEGGDGVTIITIS